MKKLLMMMSAAVALMLNSCIEHHTTISLNQDGSGTITEETAMGGPMLAMIAQMAALGGEDAADPMADMASKEKSEAKAKTMGEGVTLSKFEKIDEDTRKGATVTFAFEDINKLTYAFGDSMSEMGGNPTAGGEKAEAKPMEFSYKDGVLTLKNDIGDDEAVGGDEEETAEEAEINPQELAQARQMMGDMKVSLKVVLPGGIEETNASHVDGNTVTLMYMDMGKLLENPEAFAKLQKQDPQSPDDMRAALKGVEGVTVETKEEVTIKLK